MPTCAPPAEPVDVPDVHVFDRLIATSRVPVLVDFWAPWCAPCRAVAPEVEKVARSLRGRLLVAKVNTDVFPDLAGRYRIRSIPTFIVFRNGAESVRRSGAFDAADLVRFLERLSRDASCSGDSRASKRTVGDCTHALSVTSD